MSYNGYSNNQNSSNSWQSRLGQSMYGNPTSQTPYGSTDYTQNPSLTIEQAKEIIQNRELLRKQVQQSLNSARANYQNGVTSNAFYSYSQATNQPAYNPASYAYPQSNCGGDPTSVSRRSVERVSAPSNSYPTAGSYSQSTTPLFPQINSDQLIRAQEQQQQQHMGQVQEAAAQMYRQQQAYEAYHNTLSQSVCMPGLSRSPSASFPAEMLPAVQLPASMPSSSVFPAFPTLPTPVTSSTTEVQWGQPDEYISSSAPNPTPASASVSTPSSLPTSGSLFPSIADMGRGLDNKVTEEVEEEEEEEEEEEDKEEEEEDKELDILIASIRTSTDGTAVPEELHRSIQLYQSNREDLRKLHLKREALRKVIERGEESVEELKELERRIEQHKQQVNRYYEIYFKWIERMNEKDQQREAQREQREARRALELLEKKKKRMELREQRRLKREEERSAREARKKKK